MRFLLLLPLLLLSLACSPVQRYQLVRANDNNFYKIDTKTGEVWAISDQYTFKVYDLEETKNVMAAPGKDGAGGGIK
jgi:hypothetical protein